MMSTRAAYQRVAKAMEGYNAATWAYPAEIRSSKGFDNVARRGGKDSTSRGGSGPFFLSEGGHSVEPAEFMRNYEAFKRDLAKEGALVSQYDAVANDMRAVDEAKKRMRTEDPATIRQQFDLPDNTQEYAHAKAEQNIHTGKVVLALSSSLSRSLFLSSKPVLRPSA